MIISHVQHLGVLLLAAFPNAQTVCAKPCMAFCEHFSSCCTLCNTHECCCFAVVLDGLSIVTGESVVCLRQLQLSLIMCNTLRVLYLDVTSDRHNYCSNYVLCVSV